MTDPLDEIEADKGQRDIGRLGYGVFQGARDAGASWLEALIVTTAYFRGLIGGSSDSSGPAESEE